MSHERNDPFSIDFSFFKGTDFAKSNENAGARWRHFHKETVLH